MSSASLLEVHERELDRFRHSMNLIGPGRMEFHFEDCMAGLDGFELEGDWADLGSGAGFPGLVMAHLFPELHIELVESRQKRASFLRHVLMTAGVERSRVEVTHGRAEAMPEGLLDGVVSRAFASPARVLEHAQRLLKPEHGSVVLFLQDARDWWPIPNWLVTDESHYAVDGRRRSTLLLTRDR